MVGQGVRHEKVFDHDSADWQRLFYLQLLVAELKRSRAMFKFLLLLVASVAIADQTPPFGNPWYLKRTAVPTTLTQLSALVTSPIPPANATVCVTEMDVSVAPGTSAVNLSIYDNQPTPAPYMQAVPVSPTSSSQGTTWQVITASSQDGCVIFPAGLTVQASATGLYIAMQGRW